MKRRLIPKGTEITGEGKGYPYTVIADLPETGIICNDAEGNPVIVQYEDVSIKTKISFFCTMKPKEDKKPEAKKNEKA